MDENGCARVLLKGNLPGKCSITFSLDGTDLLADTAITVSSVSSDRQTVSIENGSYAVSLLQDHYVYDGKTHEPKVTVSGLEEMDYIVSYSRNIDAGTAYVNVAGVGNYVGVLTQSFTIEKAAQILWAEIPSPEIRAGETAQVTANGIGALSYESDNTGVATVDGNGIVTGVGEGQATITVTASGDGNHESANVAVTVTVIPATVPTPEKTNLSACTAKLTESTYVYDGTEKKPGIQVKHGAVVLAEGMDYMVSYSKNINAGTAQVTVTGTGRFTGSLTETFTISKADNKVTASDYVKTSAPKKQVFVIDAKSGSGGTLTYSSNSKSVTVSSSGKATIAKDFVGTAVVTVSAAASANYNTASRQITITVNPSGTKLSSVKSPSAKKMKVKWAKNPKVSGYEIQYSTSKKFTGSVKVKKVKKPSTTSVTVSKLAKGKKYYVRIRTYKTVAGRKYYSSWSGKKKVKI